MPLALLVAKAYGIGTGVQVILGTAVATAAAYFLPDDWRIQKPKVDEFRASEASESKQIDRIGFEKGQWKREIPLMLRNGLLQTAFFVWLGKVREDGHIKLGTGLVENSKLKTALLIGSQFVAYFWIFDVYYYLLHRFALHGPFWWIHEPHHRTYTPNALTAFVFHPIEAIVTGGFVHFLAWLAGGKMHQGTVFAVTAFGVLNSLYVHLGYQVLPTWVEKDGRFNWIMTTQVHDLHHSRVRCNYGGFTTVWDRMLGTLPLDVTEATLERIDKQVAEAKEAKINGKTQ